MEAEKPTVRSIDDYDGLESWEEEEQDPPEEYREDVKATRNQYHKMMHEYFHINGTMMLRNCSVNMAAKETPCL